jgi:hypothetical protein
MKRWWLAVHGKLFSYICIWGLERSAGLRAPLVASAVASCGSSLTTLEYDCEEPRSCHWVKVRRNRLDNVHLVLDSVVR